MSRSSSALSGAASVAATPAVVAPPTPPVDAKPAATATPAQLPAHLRVTTLEAALAEKDAALAAAMEAKLALEKENARQADEIAALKAQLERSRSELTKFES